MDKINVDCYDIFNDYLGLSNVVGRNDPSFYLMKSLLRQQDGLFDGRTLSHEVSKCSSRHEAFGSQRVCSSLPTSPKIGCTVRLSNKTSSSISDVERLFGRGAKLQTTDPSRVIYSQKSAGHNASISSHDRTIHANPCASLHDSNSLHASHNTELNDASIHSTLDAIIHKYNATHKQSRVEVNSFNEGRINNHWVDITSLTAALAKVAATYDEQLKTFHNYDEAEQKIGLNKFPEKQPSPNQGSSPTRFVGCSFCKNNKEVKEWYLSHQLKDFVGRVTCPVLRSYVCPLCDATADNAHTIGHCPLNPDRRGSLPLAIRSKANATGKKKIA